MHFKVTYQQAVTYIESTERIVEADSKEEAIAAVSIRHLTTGRVLVDSEPPTDIEVRKVKFQSK